MANIRNLAGQVDEERHDRGILVAVHNEALFMQSPAEVVSVPRQLLDTPNTFHTNQHKLTQINFVMKIKPRQDKKKIPS
jgi:hypothetical protein